MSNGMNMNYHLANQVDELVKQLYKNTSPDEARVYEACRQLASLLDVAIPTSEVPKLKRKTTGATVMAPPTYIRGQRI